MSGVGTDYEGLRAEAERTVAIAAVGTEPLTEAERRAREEAWGERYAADAVGTEPRGERLEGFCQRTDLEPHRPHHWRRRPDGSYGDYDDEGDMVWCLGAAPAVPRGEDEQR